MDTVENQGSESPAAVELPQGAKNPRKENYVKVGTPNGDTVMKKAAKVNSKELKATTGTQNSDTGVRRRFQEMNHREKKIQIPRIGAVKTSPRRNSTGSLNIGTIDLTWNEEGSKKKR